MEVGEAKEKGQTDKTWVLPSSVSMTSGWSLKPLQSFSHLYKGGIYHIFLRILLRLTKLKLNYIPPSLLYFYLPAKLTTYLSLYFSISFLFCLALCLSDYMFIYLTIHSYKYLSYCQYTSLFPDFLSILLLSIYLI